MADIYKKWKLACTGCGTLVELSCWGDHLPSRCVCGSAYKEEGSDKLVGISQRDQILEELAELNK